MLNMPFDIAIDPSSKSDAENGEKVVVQITEWPGPDSKLRIPVGKIIGRFVGQSLNDVEMQAILVHSGFPLYFEADVLAEANALPRDISPEEIAKRRDFRDILTITIDPEDAKDFDDALSYRVLEDGGC